MGLLYLRVYVFLTSLEKDANEQSNNGSDLCLKGRDPLIDAIRQISVIEKTITVRKKRIDPALFEVPIVF